MDTLISEARRRYGEVFSVEARGITYVFRPLTHIEFRDITENEELTSAEVEDEIVKTAVIYPTDLDLDYVPAGIITSVFNEVMRATGYKEPKEIKELFELKRKDAEKLIHLMKAYVIAAMPTYKDTDLDDLTFTQLVEKVVLAEAILDVKALTHGVDPEELMLRINIKDPEEEALQQEYDSAKHNLGRKPGTASANDPIAQKLKAALG
jgi:hypothetical protein